ncbi:HpsJ family protein [Leptothoe sp. LEGE 181152]|nr:HpsJ family protein [Leptothoe sp. LEGE 181152]
MTSLPRPFPSKANQTDVGQNPQMPAAKNICLVVGFTCLLGFLVDMLVLATPLNVFALEWRINVMQQVGDRSIVLLLAVGMLLFATFEQRQLKRSLGYACLALGVAFVLSCGVVIRDNLVFQKQALQNINNQEQQIQTQIEQVQVGGSLPENVTLEQLQQASQQLSSQAQALKQNARQGITKNSVASLGNLIAVGLGLVGLGRLGIKRG